LKRLILFSLAGCAFAACNDQATESKDATKDSTATTMSTPMNYPYTIDHPDYWDMGSSENTMVALSALKAYENGNIPETMKYFGDSIHLQFDALGKTLPADTVQSMFTNFRNAHKTYTIKMGDWNQLFRKIKKKNGLRFGIVKHGKT
jgi:hypothetical protein